MVAEFPILLFPGGWVMQESIEVVAIKIQLKPYTLECKVERFSEKYANYNHDQGTNNLLSWLVMD